MADQAFIDAWLGGKTADDFELLEHGGRVLWPDTLRRLRKVDGKATFIEQPICIRVPRLHEKLEALATTKVLASQYKIDREQDAADFDQLRVVCETAIALRDPKAPHGQLHSAEVLLSPADTGVSFSTLALVAAKVEVFSAFEDPRLETIDEELAIKTAFAVAEVRNLSPLVAIGGAALDSCIISMAVALRRSLLDKSSQRSAESSNPAPSRRKSSAQS